MNPHGGCSTDVVLWADEIGSEIRRMVLDGAVVVFPPTPQSVALADFARKLMEEAFAPLAPPIAQNQLDEAELAAVLGQVKPKFTHHPRSWSLMADVMRALDLDDGQLFADVPRVRLSSSGDHLRVGLAHAQPPHRDTWWGSPFAQLNFWGPVYPMERGTGMDLYPVHYGNPIANSSDRFDVHHWQTVGRHQAGQQLGPVDTRGIPEPGCAPAGGAFSVTLPVGGLMAFSGAHLHATRPNASGASRISIDFRVVAYQDLEQRNGPANLDSRCTGTALGDFRHLVTRQPLPPEMFERYGSTGPPTPPAPVAV